MPALTLPLLWGQEEFSCSSVEAELQVDPSHTWHRLPEVCGCYQEGAAGGGWPGQGHPWVWGGLAGGEGCFPHHTYGRREALQLLCQKSDIFSLLL